MKRTKMAWCVVGVCAAVAGCSSAEDRPLEKELDRVGTTSQPLLLLTNVPARVDCNDQMHVTTRLVAHDMAPQGQPPVYRRSIGELLADLSPTGSCAADYGATKCQQWHDYTAAVYSQIYGAAGYYYRVDDMFIDPLRNQLMQSWIAIPILDATTTSPGYYGTYPGQYVIHTPAFAPPIEYGAPTIARPFWLHDADHTNLWSLVSNVSLNTSNVSGRVRTQQCIAIVDPAGNFLDYSAELEEHDPNGCGGCAY